ncbi:uncharacterized protein KGF55_002241 [Candida pseudojiufengensis]|uniref:uncharacterized protein n=1 Tax=Candida pseudojiufengensis TaxID=497109 RepID=UPI0022255302|nr:uncharacterized protein KGF55_002241 [Candida pseudojiufengensis]KAI5964299.1 hypothetical protein KGF55_002241 [Candida pseudojiufengensis]
MNTSTSNVVPNSTSSSKYNFLPKFNHHSNLQNHQVASTNQSQSRIVSNDLVDSIANSLSYNRTVSSSSSILSTPSNNIRKYQQRQQQQNHQSSNQLSQNQKQLAHNHQNRHNRHHNTEKDEKHSSRITRSGQLIKNKLLNLHQSHKVLQPNPIQSQQTQQPSQQQQQQQQQQNSKLIQDAEYYTRTVIFPELSSDEELSTNDENEEMDEDDEDFESYFKKTVNSIPGYTKGELTLLINNSQTNLDHEDEKKLLQEHKRKEMSKQERSFMKTSSLSIRRQLQVTQKKEILTKMFGNHNNLNNEYITNNTEISSIGNSFNLQMVFNEDREEIQHLIEEDNLFKTSMDEFRELRNQNSEKNLIFEDDEDEEINQLLKKIPIGQSK